MEMRRQGKVRQMEMRFQGRFSQMEIQHQAQLRRARLTTWGVGLVAIGATGFAVIRGYRHLTDTFVSLLRLG